MAVRVTLRLYVDLIWVDPWLDVGECSLDDCARWLGEPLLAVAWDRDLVALGLPVGWHTATLYQATGMGHCVRMYLESATIERTHEEESSWYHFMGGERWIRSWGSAYTEQELTRMRF